MSQTVHVFDFLQSPAKHAAAAVFVLFGDEPFLKQLSRNALRQQLLGEQSEDTPSTTLEGDVARWRDVADELGTASLFGGGSKRFVVIEQADKFVTQHRPQLEDYVAKPSRLGTLVLEVDSWPANTKLYKLMDKDGVQVDCRPPEIARGRSKVPDDERIEKWLRSWAEARHQVALDARAACVLLELVGPIFGMLDQDLAKLALFVKPGGKITADMVREIVGGWRAKTAWELVDAACDGNVPEAFMQLDRLLQSGDHPIAVFGQISWSLRRYNAAVRAYEAAERAGRRISLREALQQAGFNDWPKGSLDGAEGRLKQLGRDRAGKMYRWLLDLDLALKGTHSHDDRARFALEHLILKMAKLDKRVVSNSKAS